MEHAFPCCRPKLGRAVVVQTSRGQGTPPITQNQTLLRAPHIRRSEVMNEVESANSEAVGGKSKLFQRAKFRREVENYCDTSCVQALPSRMRAIRESVSSFECTP